MKHIFATLSVFLFIGVCVNAQNLQVKKSDYSGVQITFTTPTPTVTKTNIQGQTYSTIHLNGFSEQTAVGMPALPALVKLIEIPLGEGLNYTIDNMVVDTIDANIIELTSAIIPAQPSRRKSDTTRHQLVINNRAYNTDAFCGNSTIELEAIGVARCSNLARLTFNPIKWNPVTNQLIVVKNITVTVQQTNTDITATRRMKQLHSNGAFDNVMPIINNIGPKAVNRNAPLRYTIIAHSMFRGELDEFVIWKKRQGFIVDLVYTDDANVGSTTSSIKDYLQGLYDNATAELPAPTYVLFVGDIQQIPATTHSYSGDVHYSDLDYCCWTTGDYLPDCYYGRFSAQNVTDLQSQISKTLMYEQYTFPDDSYLSNAALIAGVDRGSSNDYAYCYADPTMDYIAKTYITSANGFSNITYYKNNTSFAPTGVTVTGSSNSNSTSNALKNLYNQGCGWVNYSAHGGETSWSSPSFYNSDVANMTNNNKPMIMIGNCCLTNSFQVDACFGEALLRKNNNAGAVIYIGGSNSTYWTEDFYWSVGIRSNISNTCNPSYDASHLGMYDHLYHSHGEPFAQYFTTASAMIYAGNSSVESSTSSLKEYYWQIYHVMGDPSLMPYIHGAANVPTANIPNSIPMGCNIMTIQTEPYAYVGFTDPEHNLVSAAFADENGNATLNFAPISQIGEFEIVISAQGFQPYTQTVNIIANGAFINISNFQPTTTLTANGDISFNVELNNLGTETADSISIEYISINNLILLDTTGQISIPSTIQSGESLSMNNVCTGHIWGNTPDQSVAKIKIIVRWGSQSSEMSIKTFNYIINADKMEFNSYSIVDNFDSLGSAILTMRNINNGHATLNHANVTVISLDPIISITNNTIGINNIAPGQITNCNYTLTLNGNMPEHRKIPILQSINNGFVTRLDTIYYIFGEDISIINFDDSTFGSLNYTQGDYDWVISSQSSYSPNYSLRSHVWSGSNWDSNNGNGKTTQISFTNTSTYDDSLTFYCKVSTEATYDIFHIYIDDEEIYQASGDNEWQRLAFAVPQGSHTFLFSYVKDYSVSNGLDAVFVDDIHLPGTGFTGFRYLLDTVCQGEQYIFNLDTIETNELEPGNYIYYDSIDEDVYYLTLVVRQTPNIAIIHDRDTIKCGESIRLNATSEGVERYLWNTGETNPIIDVYPTETTTYTVTGYSGICSHSTSVTIYVEGSVNIVEANEQHSILIYPNPANNIITVEGNEIVEITICDILGRQVISANQNLSSPIDISQINAGIYFIQAKFEDGRITTSKFIKK